MKSFKFPPLSTWGFTCLVLLLLCAWFFMSWPRGEEAFFARIPILHGGRVQALSTFAREHLLAFSGNVQVKVSPSLAQEPKKSHHVSLSATAWLIEVLLNPQYANTLKIFKISNPDIIDILNLKESKDKFYSFKDISKSLDKNLPLLQNIEKQAETEHSLLEKQLLHLYSKARVYLNLSRSLSLILPLFSYNFSPSPIKGLIPHKTYNYLEMVKFRHKIKQHIKTIKKERFDDLLPQEQALAILSFRIESMAQDEDNNVFKIIPPQWKDNKEHWHSPWWLIKTGRGTPASASYLHTWKLLLKTYHTESLEQAKKTYQSAITLSKGFAKPYLLYMEALLNHFDFFQKSLWLYILCFVLFAISPPCRRWTLCLFFLGVLFHAIGLVFRVVIMGRPPVATLYESILFVSFIVALVSLITAKTKKKDYILLGAGSFLGASGHFIAFKYKGLESMELLVPVLNTHFWLSTHVICITIGYGFAILSSLMAHIYVYRSCLKCFGRPLQKTSKEDLWNLYKSLRFFMFIALFFCVLGTILGGIWADQSWGRFWGWDPKENGALLIIMGLLVLLHGYKGGVFKETGMALGLVLSSITVALSWFGVNLLGVGLHSYGFVNGALYGLLAFCGVELLMFFGALVLLNKKRDTE